MTSKAARDYDLTIKARVTLKRRERLAYWFLAIATILNSITIILIVVWEVL